MVSMYFGLPGCGKTTMLAKLAYDACYKKHSPYKNVYGNIALTGIPNYTQIESQDLGKYMMTDCLILIDEGTLQFDSRDYKNFSKALVKWFMTHRHYCADIAIFAQQWDGVDRKIRAITDKVYYLHKGFFTGWYKTKVWRIPYGILIPDKNDSHGDKYGEIVQGYYKPPFIARLLTPSLKRRKYYPFFDSWEREDLPPLPAERFEKQKAHNLYSYENLCNMLKETPKKRIFRRRKLTKMIAKAKKCLTS